MKELSVRKVADNKFELYRNIPNSLDVIDGAVYHCLQKLGYRVETRETAEIRNGVREYLSKSMSRKWVLREEPSRGIVKYYWTEEVVGIIVGPTGGMMFRKKKDDLTECTLFNPIRLPKDSDESYQERRKLAFEKALELIQLLAENGGWPIDPISNWEIAQEFTFDADAITVCNRLMKGKEQRTIKMTDNLWAFECYLSAVPTLKAMYAIVIYANISEGTELAWMNDEAIWVVHNQEIAEIALTQDKPSECKASLYVDSDTKKWGRYKDVGMRFIGRLWNELINDWVMTGPNESDVSDNSLVITQKSKRGRSRYTDQEKLDVLHEWDAIDPSMSGLTLDEFLELKFGTTGGILNVAKSTFHGWRRRLTEKGLYKNS